MNTNNRGSSSGDHDGNPVPDHPSGQTPAENPRDNPANYVLRVFYYNHEDAALMVPMRYGGGIDFNYARWPGRTVIVTIGFLLFYALFSLFR